MNSPVRHHDGTSPELALTHQLIGIHRLVERKCSTTMGDLSRLDQLYDEENTSHPDPVCAGCYQPRRSPAGWSYDAGFGGYGGYRTPGSAIVLW